MKSKIQFLLVCLLMAIAATASAEEKLVRVGWFDSSFNHFDENGQRTGYSYEYQLRIAANTGWTYEYVEGTWNELYRMLKRGEIDLLSDVSHSAEREGDFLYSYYPMGTEYYYIFSFADRSNIYAGEFETLRSKHVAVVKNTFQARYLKQWCEQHNLTIDIDEIDEPEGISIAKLKDGEYDAFASVSGFMNDDSESCLPVAQIGSSEIYFAINKERYDLKRDLDRAMAQIRYHNPYFNSNLHERYFANLNSNRYLSAREIEWVKQHGVIRIGYRDNYLPFCGQDEKGEVSGLLRDFIENASKFFKNADIKIEAVAYPTINQAIDAVSQGEVDVAFPVNLPPYSAEQQQLLLSDECIESGQLAVVRANDYFHTDVNVRVAVNSMNPNYISLVEEQFPNWTEVDFASTQLCLEGIAANKADVLLISSHRAGVLDNAISSLGLKVVGTGAVMPLSFATAKKNNRLFSIVNRIAHSMSESQIQGSLVKYAATRREVSVKDFIRDNLGFATASVALIIALISLLLVYNMRMRRREKDASQAKTRFLFNMSHDIRTPMNAIMGYTELMKQSLDDPVKNSDYLAKIRSASNFLLGLINNVLEVAHIESGKMELNEKPILVKNLLDELNRMYKEETEKKDIQLTMEQESKTEAIYCDELKLGRIFLNLLSNAVKYTPAGGTVTLICKEQEDPRAGYATFRVTVSDTGVGMSKEFLPHLFEDFTREKTYTDNKISGTGLGTAIVKKLVELMGGTIEVESELGKGTTFTITMSHRIANVADVEQEKVSTDEGVKIEGKHVLLAEDNDLNAEIATEILQQMGLSVDHAADGAQCVEMLEQAKPGTYDIVLMDIQMPHMNGFDAARHIRALKDKQLAGIPILAMTANAFAIDRKNVLAAGMNAHLAKPIDVAELRHALEKYLKQ